MSREDRLDKVFRAHRDSTADRVSEIVPETARVPEEPPLELRTEQELAVGRVTHTRGVQYGTASEFPL